MEFVATAVEGAETVLREDVAAPLLRAGAARPESLRARAHATYAGRGRPFAVAVDGAGAVFVRQYLHGGLLARLTGDLYAGDGRFREELELLRESFDAGGPVCEPLGIVSRSAGAGLRRGWLLVREVPGAKDLRALLDGAPAPAARRAALVSAGRAVRALHDAGVEHPDLHLKNLLRAPDGRVLVLDLDRARRLPSLSRERRLAGLFRFDRYAAKAAAEGAHVTRADRMRFLRAYAGGDWPPREERRALAARLARHIARHEVLRARRAAAARA